MSETLFDGYEPAEVIPEPKLSADRRRTKRQADNIAAGIHPLTGGPLHELASRHRDSSAPKADPFTCGSCKWREVLRHPHGKRFPKCVFPGNADAADYERPGWTPPRFSASAASDVRAWWPACRSYTPGDTRLSPDAARCIP
ncbi:hypothetical protein [uncultured Nocardioides sp.]|jgi:hypothetical protein|uniref:hypothetical protein n=1 Tax=uncultured Nocardioides sp. TaxID=198441 RepID=UPI002615AC34|nr:hypothetical protein [uncultured Nocardioides sp.]HRD59358.1 hypothetical protein [Nocardioides sp.]